jgi:hypothetical protein
VRRPPPRTVRHVVQVAARLAQSGTWRRLIRSQQGRQRYTRRNNLYSHLKARMIASYRPASMSFMREEMSERAIGRWARSWHATRCKSLIFQGAICHLLLI